jgi:hypothetical protein
MHPFRAGKYRINIVRRAGLVTNKLNIVQIIPTSKVISLGEKCMSLELDGKTPKAGHL